jgi:hypothetical protein
MSTSNTVTVCVPHRLTKDEARRRIQGQFVQLRTQTAGLMTQLDEHWSGDDMTFTAHIVGAPVTGRLRVEDTQVRVEVDLPWFLAALANSVRQAVAHQTHQLLEHRQTA